MQNACILVRKSLSTFMSNVILKNMTWSLHKNNFQLVDKLSGLSIHLLDRDAGMTDLDVTVGQQTLGNVGVGVHNVTELDLDTRERWLRFTLI